MAANGDDELPDFSELPPEVWHKIAYDFAGLKAADIAALRLASPRRLAREVFTAGGYDRALWESAAGVRWCRDNDRPDALVVCLRRTGINPAYYTLLTWAAIRDYVKVVSYLLKDPRVDSYSEALYHSARCGSADTVRLLLEDGRADPTVSNYRPLAVAAMAEDPECLRLLLADPRAPQKDDQFLERIFGIAVSYGRIDTIQMLLEEAVASVNDEDFPSPDGYGRIAFRDGDSGTFATGLRAVMDWAEQHGSRVLGPLFVIATRMGHMGAFVLGLSGGANLIPYIMDGLAHAAARDDLEMVTAMLESHWLNGVVASGLPITQAAKAGAAGAVAMLLGDERFARSLDAALMEASMGLHYDAVKVLLADSRADPLPALREVRQIERKANATAKGPMYSIGDLSEKQQAQRGEAQEAARARGKKAAAIFDLIAEDPRLTR